MTFLERRGLIEVDERLGTAPFETWGFELNAEGLVECERLGLDGAPSHLDGSPGTYDDVGANLDKYVPDVLRSRFKAIHELGAGSYATVYLVQERESLEFFALKVPYPNREAEQRAAREADVVERLRHRHVLPVVEHEHSGHWFILEHAAGTLGQLFDRGKLAADADGEVVWAVGLALVHAHTADILHRDLHPENVLRVDGRWVVADWGLTIARGQKRLTRTRSAGGNETWIAPEQLRSLKDATVRSDLYSLGRLVEWLATRALPDPLRPGSLAQGHPLGPFVAAATQLDPENRPTSVEAALRLLPSAEVALGRLAGAMAAPRQTLPHLGHSLVASAPDTIGLSKFSLICGLAKHGSGNTEEFHQARTEANVLHAHLVVVREARAAHYFTATAYAVFCLRGDHDRRKAERVEEAREKVETLLCDPSKPFDVPTDDEVCRFAAIAWANVGHPVWLKL